MDLCQITILRTSYQRLRRADDMNIVLDTNILISAAWSPGRNASNILNAVFARKFTACYDYRILEEYHRVLHYPKFKFYEWEINAILEPMIKNGILHKENAASPKERRAYAQKSLLLEAALNLAGTKAASANVHLAGGTVYHYGNLLYIGSP